MCEIRWVKSKFFIHWVESVESVIHWVESIQRNDDPQNCFNCKTVIVASWLLKQLQNSGFIISIEICHYIYGYTKGSSK